MGRLYFLRNRFPQGIALSSGCIRFSVVVHELGHAIGFYHEHNRPDRDDYISLSSNINPELATQLERIPESESNTLGLGYDYASIMHYGSLRGVISAKNDLPFGNAKELSPLDIQKTNRLYSCGTYVLHSGMTTTQTLLWSLVFQVDSI